MKEDTVNKAKDLLDKILFVKKLLQFTKNQHTVSIIFADPESSSEVCNDTDSIENIRTILIKVHQDNLTVLQDEFDKL